jgi:hypothetical protein
MEGTASPLISVWTVSGISALKKAATLLAFTAYRWLSLRLIVLVNNHCFSQGSYEVGQLKSWVEKANKSRLKRRIPCALPLQPL